ncbi:MAG: hypothetical protein ACLR8Y_18225, partial [Alistipes indistinctus]
MVMTLAEERYFKPIFDWNDSRGLIYGCDNMGRGKQPLHYLDYFRATSWFTAPGNDAPARGSSFIQTRGFRVRSPTSTSGPAHGSKRSLQHGLGQQNGNGSPNRSTTIFLAGGNLVCMHGLYRCCRSACSRSFNL